MAFDWLYGGTTMDEINGHYLLHSLLLDPDTIREVYGLFAAELAIAEAFRLEPSTMPLGMAPQMPIDVTTLATASDWDRQSIIIEGSLGSLEPRLLVRLMRDSPAQVTFAGPQSDFDKTTASGMTMRDFALRVARKIEAEGKPRKAWKHQLRLVPWFVWLAIAGTWLWVAIAERPPLSVIVLGSLSVAAALPVARHFGKLVFRGYDVWRPGNRIRSISRTEFRQRRADNWTNAKVTAIVLPAGAVVGAVATVLVK